ncbi:hypothetical protein FHS25_007033 [Rhizobium laguerreae]|uniref:Uncharacterized protein n=1 Tax=Rhizobium laguerreae TaxID=1076926 RepID=A0ABR6GKY8_9HYPH|nr:hypothetical protein [Rhizobium laguerreae]MBB3166516.1 hypothetical protein [Rhizobium laguerreae]OOO49225.1 hypothetical protein BS630_15495 [Rhizobium laguerreae]
MDEDSKAQLAIEGADKELNQAKKNPQAGPHTQDHLTDESKTPGAGTLPERDEETVTPGSG